MTEGIRRVTRKDHTLAIRVKLGEGVESQLESGETRATITSDGIGTQVFALVKERARTFVNVLAKAIISSKLVSSAASTEVASIGILAETVSWITNVGVTTFVLV